MNVTKITDNLLKGKMIFLYQFIKEKHLQVVFCVSGRPSRLKGISN